MFGLLAVLAAFAVVGAIGIFFIAALVKAVLWVVFIPFRLVFWLFVPLFLVAKLVGVLLAALLIGPVILLAVTVALIAAVAAVAVPLLPVLFIGFVIWLLTRSSRPAVA